MCSTENRVLVESINNLNVYVSIENKNLNTCVIRDKTEIIKNLVR